MTCKIHNNANFEGLDILAKNLYEFAHKRFNFSKPVIIVFESNMDNAGKVFAPTGNYDPQTKKVTIYVDQRHPKDILRSLAHELIHHNQNCTGNFNNQVNTDPGYAQKDQRMREMEGDAYRTGNVMLFRDWEDSYKKRSNLMNENKEKLEEAGEMTDAQKKYFGKKEEEESETETSEEDTETSEEEEDIVKESDKEWYSNELHEALLKKFKIKK